MKVTKVNAPAPERKVIAFYSGGELVFRNQDDGNNTAITKGKGYPGTYPFDDYLNDNKYNSDLITFYEGDTIQIQL